MICSVQSIAGRLYVCTLDDNDVLSWVKALGAVVYNWDVIDSHSRLMK